MSEGKVMQTGNQNKTKVSVQGVICKSSRIQKRKSQYL